MGASVGGGLTVGPGVTDGELEGWSQGGTASIAAGLGGYADFAVAADGKTVTRTSSAGLVFGGGFSLAPMWTYTW